MSKKTRSRFILGFLVLGVFSTSFNGSCGSSDTNKDAGHTPDGKVDTSRPIKNVAFPDGYRNVVIKCDGLGHLIYNTSHHDTEPSIIAVANDTLGVCPGTKK